MSLLLELVSAKKEYKRNVLTIRRLTQEKKAVLDDGYFGSIGFLNSMIGVSLNNCKKAKRSIRSINREIKYKEVG